ncbi:MAG: hypothetical protein GY944_09715, partial [bacterium]|nr:hypothetical protein [bacterium]
RRAYTFAKVVLVTEPWEDLARADLKARTDEEPDDDAIREWIEFMQEALEPLEVGQICVYLDGSVIPVDEKNVAFDGWFATHDLSELPHAAAMAEPALLDRMLGDVSYWEERELPDGDCTRTVPNQNCAGGISAGFARLPEPVHTPASH